MFDRSTAQTVLHSDARASREAKKKKNSAGPIFVHDKENAKEACALAPGAGSALFPKLRRAAARYSLDPRAHIGSDRRARTDGGPGRFRGSSHTRRTPRSGLTPVDGRDPNYGTRRHTRYVFVVDENGIARIHVDY